MKIYTKTGDKGETSLFGGKRVKKDSLRVQTYGSIDELNAYIGLCLATIQTNTELMIESKKKHIDIAGLLTQIQGKLFCIGSLTARDTNKPLNIGDKMIQITDADIELLERSIDTMDTHIPQLSYFILPTGTISASHLQVARTIARRCERMFVSLEQDEQIAQNVLKYINRLSDLLFTLARYVNILEKGKEMRWQY